MSMFRVPASVRFVRWHEAAAFAPGFRMGEEHANAAVWPESSRNSTGQPELTADHLAGELRRHGPAQRCSICWP